MFVLSPVTSWQPGGELANEAAIWDDLLERYVDDQGLVNYKELRSETDQIQVYLDYLADNVPADNQRAEKLAYYINLYNAATVKLILDNYPLKSIKDIKSPWARKWIRVGSDTVSLGYIEHKVLRKLDDPRIHFAINCASFSCPKLLNTSYKAAIIDAQLEQVTRNFINDPTRNQIEQESIKLSEIFKWYKKDFTSESGSLLEYLRPYSEEPIPDSSKIEFLKYDWGLNE